MKTNHFVTSEQLPNPKQLAVAEKIQRKRLQILVHSCLYYNMNTNLIEDRQWDEWAKELVALQKKYPKTAEQVVFAKAFKDFDGSTGFDLPLNHKWVKRKAMELYKLR